jgi:NAD(P)-dependent dehydrogenase (short-subunit alcohol dehydrogenase family)
VNAANGDPEQFVTLAGLGFSRGDVIVITGAGTGIGRATAIAAARAGLAVAAWGRTAETLRETVGLAEQAAGTEHSDGTAIPVVIDLTHPDELDAAWARTAELGPPRYLVSNAAPKSRGASTATRMSTVDGVTAALGSMITLTETWLETFPGEVTSAVYTGSIAGAVSSGSTGADWYAPAKAGLLGYTRHLAHKWRGRPRFNIVAPGLIETSRTLAWKDSEGPYWDTVISRTPLGRVGRPEEIAHCLLFLASPAASFVNGAMLVADGGRTIAI